MNREPIYAALFALLQTATPSGPSTQWAKSGRSVIPISDVPSNLRPALFVDEIGDEYKYAQATGVDPTVRLHADVYIYTVTSDPNAVSPATRLNNAIDAVDAVLRPGSTGWQNLGKLVRWVRILGTMKIFQGNEQQDGIAVLALEIMAMGN